MKSKFLAIATSILLCAIISLPTFADSDYISISCPPTASIGSSTTCTITGHTSNSVSGVSATISTDNLNIQQFSADPSWYGDTNDGQIVITTENNKIGTFAIGTIAIQPSAIGATGNVSLHNVIFSNSSFTEYSVSDASASISATAATPEASQSSTEEPTEPSIDPTSLSSLIISGHNIDFASDKYTYSIQIADNTSSLDITATPVDDTSVITITGNENLTDGSIVKITITNGDAKSIYRIKISTPQPIVGQTQNPSIDPTIIIAIIASILILATGIVAFFLLRKKKKSPASSLTFQPTPRPTTPRPTTNPFLNTKPTIDLPVNTPPTPQPQPHTPQPPTAPYVPPAPKPNPFLSATQQAQSTANTRPNPFLSPTPSRSTTQPTKPVAPTAFTQPPTSNRPISLNQIPFDATIPPSPLKKPTTPIIFES